MESNEFEKFKEQLEKQKQKNNKKIDLYGKRVRIAAENSFGNKIVKALRLSFLSYYPLSIISGILIKTLGLSVVTNIIPASTFSSILIGSSLGVGTIATFAINKKEDIKKRYKRFSDDETEIGKLKEKTHAQIELEKAENRNKVVDSVIEILESNQTIQNKLSSQFNLDKHATTSTKSEAEKHIKELSSLISEQYANLDILTTQNVLNSNFGKIRSKWERRYDTALAIMFAFSFGIILPIIPNMFVQEAIVYSSSFAKFSALFGPSIVGALSTCGYMRKRNSNFSQVFNHFNLQLGENALPQTFEKGEDIHTEEESIQSLINQQIRELTLGTIQLKESQVQLELLNSGEVTHNNESAATVSVNKLDLYESMQALMPQIPSDRPQMEGARLVEAKAHEFVKRRPM